MTLREEGGPLKNRHRLNTWLLCRSELDWGIVRGLSVWLSPSQFYRLGHGKGTRVEILGIGTDIVECPRIGKMIEQHGELFLRRVYTEREIRYCQARKHAIEHFAGRWAAKEAILKAMGTGRSHGIAWTNIEVRNGQGGQPRVLVCGAAREATIERGIADILVSISHCRTYATAYAMALARQAPVPIPTDPAYPAR
jgi:holo-[acyl-carrier protein] synthase